MRWADLCRLIWCVVAGLFQSRAAPCSDTSACDLRCSVSLIRSKHVPKMPFPKDDHVVKATHPYPEEVRALGRVLSVPQPATGILRSGHTRPTRKYPSSGKVSTDSTSPVSRLGFTVGTG